MSNSRWTVSGEVGLEKAFLNGIELSNENFNFFAGSDKDLTWYDAGTKATLQLGNYGDCNLGKTGGLFRGVRNGKSDGEMCYWDEFDICDKDGTILYRAGEVIIWE